MSYLNSRQKLILSAALDAPSKALESFKAWQNEVRLDDIDGAGIRLVPLIYKNIGRSIPNKDVAGRLKGISRYTWIRNSYRVNLCARLLGQLNSRGVSSVLLKGSALMAGITDDLSTRQMGDCDLLVADRDKHVAFEAMEREGMRTVPANWAALSEPERESFHGLTFEIPGKLQDAIDLHWRPLREVASSELTDRFFTHARPVVVYGQQTHIPCAEHMLLHCLVHGGEADTRVSYDWIADAFLISKFAGNNLDWRLFARTALDFRLGALARHALEILQKETAIEVPQEAWDGLKSAPMTLSDRLEAAYRGKPDKQHAAVTQTVRLLQTVRRSSTRDAELPFTRALGKMWRLFTTGFIDARSSSRGGDIWYPTGWHYPESTGRWTAARLSSVCLSRSPEKEFGDVLRVTVRSPRWQVFAMSSGWRILLLRPTFSGGEIAVSAHLPPTLRRKTTLSLQFFVLRLWSPARRRGSRDLRWLGIFVGNIRTASSRQPAD